MRELRHYYASVLLDAGASIKAVADHLGHTDLGFTSRVYTHLLPNSEERARTQPTGPSQARPTAPEMPQAL